MAERKTLTDAEIKTVLNTVRKPDRAIARLAGIVGQAQERGDPEVRLPTEAAVALLGALKYVATHVSKNDGTDFKTGDKDAMNLPPTDVDW
jgi:hypothetical protein